MADEEKIKIYRSIFFPGIIVLVLWVVKAVDFGLDLDLNRYGLHPMHKDGLIGIFTAPLLHADLAHLFANSVPFLILGALLFYFYRQIAWMILILIWIITGLWVWVFARGEGIHIGASGVVYGLASFLFFSGILRREKTLMVITMLVTFLYGGMIWGLFPQLFPNQPISWESHLMGLISGAILAVYYRKKGPQRKEWQWDEEDEENDDPNAPWLETNVNNQPPEQGI